jgi:hypothetical protein
MSDDIIYYNMTIGNNDIATSGNGIFTSIPASQEALNAQPILENPSDYYGCIIRMEVPGFNLSQFSVIIQTPVLDINKTIYSFTLSNNGFQSEQTFLIFTPEFFNIPSYSIPKVGTPTQTFNEYYYIFNIRTFINMMNTALETATTDLNAKSGLSITPPFYSYDSITQLLSLYADKTFFDSSIADPIQIWFNNPLWKYFTGVEASAYLDNNGGYNVPFGKDNLLKIYNDHGLNLATIPSNPAITYLKMTIEYSGWGYWNNLKSILITTSMNVTSEVFFLNNTSGSGQNVNYVNVLTDYTPDISVTGTGGGAGIGQQIFIYNAPSLYRLFSFNQRTPLYKISLTVNVKDTYNNIFPLLLDKATSASFKIMFIKKNIWSGQITYKK